MILNVVADGQTFSLDVPDNLLAEAQAFFNKMDADMDKGWQVGRDWVDAPTVDQRCQVVADRLLTAMENKNQQMAMLMAAYILSKAPNIETIYVDTSGEISETHFM